MKIELNIVATEINDCYALISGLFIETHLYDTNNIHLIWVNKKNSAVWISKYLPKLF